MMAALCLIPGALVARETDEIATVEFFAPEQQGAVGVEVHLKDGRVQRIICTESGEVSIF